MSEQRENPAFGRKIFFLNPTLKLKNTVIDSLRKQEFEVYILDDYHYAKGILRRNENAICYINIDEVMPIYAWFNFIKSFEYDESLKTIFIGILSSTIKKMEKDQFLLNTSIPGGFITLSDYPEDILETLVGILNINGAKGRRKYVRLNCDKTDKADILCSMGSKTYKMHLLDISAVGFACQIPIKYMSLFPKNTVVPNITITLASKSVTCSAAVFAATEKESSCLLVFLMLKGTPSETKATIREYVTLSLQLKLNQLIINTKKDYTDYTIEQLPPSGEEKIVFETEPEELEELEELEEIPEEDENPPAKILAKPIEKISVADKIASQIAANTESKAVESANNSESIEILPEYNGKASDMIMKDLF